MNIEKRIELFIQSGKTTFDLSNLGLVKIPDEIKDMANILSLDVSKNKITVIENIPPNAEEVNLSDNEIENIPEDVFPTSVTILNLSKNYIGDVSNLHITLIDLDISFNCIKDIESLGNITALAKLVASYNNLKNIPKFSSMLLYLDVSNNMIESVNVHHSVRELYISNNRLTNIEYLSKDLNVLDASNNAISRIDYIPGDVIELNLSNNKLHGIPILPRELLTFKISNNNLTSLSDIPHNLSLCDISYNRIKNLPNLTHVKKVIANGNPLSIDDDSDNIDSLCDLNSFFNTQNELDKENTPKTSTCRAMTVYSGDSGEDEKKNENKSTDTKNGVVNANNAQTEKSFPGVGHTLGYNNNTSYYNNYNNVHNGHNGHNVHNVHGHNNGYNIGQTYHHNYNHGYNNGMNHVYHNTAPPAYRKNASKTNPNFIPLMIKVVV